jgi:triacylglycerol lipase
VTATSLHPRLQEIADEFRELPDADRLQLLLEFAQDLPPLPDRYAGHQDLLERVPECQTPLFLAVEVDPDATVHLFFDAPPEAPTTRGFAGILHAGLDGLTADEVLATPGEFSSQLGIQDLVSPLRLRGMAAMLARIKNQIRRIMLCMRTVRWWTGLSPRRRLLLGGLVLVVAAIAGFAGVRLSQGEPEAVAGRPGAVLLVPGYGGSTTSLDELAARIRSTGRTATVVQLAGDGTGDLTVQARVLDGYVNRAIAAGSGPVIVIGYSAGGVVAWLWDADYGGASRVGMIITLGSPLHGARIAAVGTGYDPAQCPVACQQLAPGSALLTRLRLSARPLPPWLSLWSTTDQTVQPPDSARLPGAVNVPLQSVCPGADIAHSQLPTAPLAVGLVLRSLASDRVTAPAPGQCAALEAQGG